MKRIIFSIFALMVIVSGVSAVSVQELVEIRQFYNIFTSCSIDKNKNACRQLLATKKNTCDNGNKKADCLIVGQAYYYLQDYKNALKYLKIACNDNGSGCDYLGLMYKNGEGVKLDYKKAFGYFKKACDDNNSTGCIELGSMYHNGNGTKQDYRNALKSYKKACDNKDSPLGCAYAGAFYNDGLGVNKDKNKALQYFDKSCKTGYNQACNIYLAIKRGEL